MASLTPRVYCCVQTKPGGVDTGDTGELQLAADVSIFDVAAASLSVSKEAYEDAVRIPVNFLKDPGERYRTRPLVDSRIDTLYHLGTFHPRNADFAKVLVDDVEARKIIPDFSPAKFLEMVQTQTNLDLLSMEVIAGRHSTELMKFMSYKQEYGAKPDATISNPNPPYYRRPCRIYFKSHFSESELDSVVQAIGSFDNNFRATYTKYDGQTFVDLVSTFRAKFVAAGKPKEVHQKSKEYANSGWQAVNNMCRNSLQGDAKKVRKHLCLCRCLCRLQFTCVYAVAERVQQGLLHG